MKLFNLIPLLFLPFLTHAQCCCCAMREAGQTLYEQGRYKEAIARWETGKGNGANACADAQKCPELDSLVRNARVAWEQQEARTRMEEERLRKEREAARKQEEKKRLQDALGAPVRSGSGSPGGQGSSPFDKKTSGTTPSTGASAPSVPAAPSSPQMVLVRGGAFQMGDFFADSPDPAQRPRAVSIADFYLGQTEVTEAEYLAYQMAIGRRSKSETLKPEQARRPAIYISWYDALEYCNWLSQKEGLTPVYTLIKTTPDPNNLNPRDSQKWSVVPDWKANGYRLPTEAEWEFAARALHGKGGQQVRFGTGRDTLFPEAAIFDCNPQNSRPYSVSCPKSLLRSTVAADSMPANSLGLRHMSGNMAEWCWDWLGNANDASASEDKPQPGGVEKGMIRVVRGGSWRDESYYCRAAARNGASPDSRSDNIGLRLVRKAN